MTQPVPEPEQWQSPISEGHPVLDSMISSNAMRLQALAERRNPVTGKPEGIGLDMARIMCQHLIDDLFDAEERQAYELRFQNYLAQMIGLIEEQVQQNDAAAQIAVPNAAREGLILPGQ